MVIGERAEAAGWADFIEAAPPSIAATGGTTWRVEGAVGFAIDVQPHLLMNRVIGLGALAPATAATLDAAIEPYRSLGRQHLVHAIPGSRGEALESILRDRGYQPGRRWRKHVRGAAPVPARADLAGIEVIETDDGPAFGASAMASTGLTGLEAWFAATVRRPGWTTYLAIQGDTVIAAGQLFVVDDVGWLFNGEHSVTDQPDAQAAIVARRVEDGRRRGCRWFVSESSEPDPGGPDAGAMSLAAADFEVAYLRRNWFSPAATD